MNKRQNTYNICLPSLMCSVGSIGDGGAIRGAKETDNTLAVDHAVSPVRVIFSN